MSGRGVTFLNNLKEYTAYLALLNDQYVKIGETTLKYEAEEDALISREDWTYRFRPNGELIMGGLHLWPASWGTSVTPTGRKYTWLTYYTNPYIIVVTVFKREESI